MKLYKLHKGRKAICPVCNPEAARRYKEQQKRRMKMQVKEEVDVDPKERAYNSGRNFISRRNKISR